MYGIIANVLSDRVLRTGAKVWILYTNGDAEHPVVLGCSRSGRVVEKYTAYKRLTNYRAAWIPDHLRDRVCVEWRTKEEAAAHAKKLGDLWKPVRYFNRDGSKMLKDGISVNSVLNN